MKHSGLLLLIFAATALNPVRAETESIDLKALAKKARPAVMLLVVSDANGKEIATGTGFLVSSDGKLITNFHVIEGAASAVAKSENGGLFPVEGVLASDPKNDLVLLKLKAKDLPFLTLGNSDKIEIGTRIAIIGSPLGLEGTLSEGIVSAVRELMGDIKLLQVTAAISPGSSGSPVMNANGDVVGIASSLLRGGQALNFAVPVECGVRLIAKTTTAMKAQALNSVTTAQEDLIYSDPIWLAARKAEAVQDWVEMLKCAKILASRHPQRALAYRHLGVAFSELGFNDDALTAFRQAIKIEPDDVKAWCNLGSLYGHCRHYADAILAYRQAIKLKPDLADGWFDLANAYGDSGSVVDAIAAYRQAIKIKQNYAEAWYNLGLVYGKSGHIEEAIATFQQAIKIKPAFAEAWYNLGIAYRSAGRQSEADAAFKRVRELKPEKLM